ncbi:MAG TPA: cyclic-di-AMP receptor [Anaerolineaceae bacterium]|jgi:uncharacterized protein YaaQ|nr:cyclic-di-AMP receptor [Anaerolineales bacterium]HOG59097.1 cyclic-di-AMP receptor [Anaerolineaceae bacterium]HOR83635.1 cyclic-di-AMP receptor [Anaerolineaceae bacterium]HPL43745.1 cyclic-di-AMP receptor [Anaerolineaceae bacterium]HPY33397.1 cyclic-di-AMP receptor [Anaerolineaceae bacterium]
MAKEEGAENMKMIMAVVPKKYGENLLSALVNAGFPATYAETRGGMLRQSQMSLFIGVQAAQVPVVLGLVHSACDNRVSIHRGFGISGSEAAASAAESSQAEIASSGAVVFVWSLDQFEMP